MQYVRIHREASYVHVRTVSPATLSVDVSILTNAQPWINRVELTRFVRIRNQATSACARRDSKQSPMPKLLVRGPKSMSSVTVISIVRTMQNVLTVSASVRKDLKHPARSVPISTSVVKRHAFVDQKQNVQIYPVRSSVSVKLALLEHHHECHAKRPVKMSSVAHTLIAKRKRTKLSASVKKDGHSCQRTSQRDAWILTSAMHHRDRLECVESTLTVTTRMVDLNVRVRQASLAIPTDNVLMLMNAHDITLVEKTLSVRTLKARILAYVPKAPSLIPIHPFVASLL